MGDLRGCYGRHKLNASQGRPLGQSDSKGYGETFEVYTQANRRAKWWSKTLLNWRSEMHGSMYSVLGKCRPLAACRPCPSWLIITKSSCKRRESRTSPREGFKFRYAGWCLQRCSWERGRSGPFLRQRRSFAHYNIYTIFRSVGLLSHPSSLSIQHGTNPQYHH